MLLSLLLVYNSQWSHVTEMGLFWDLMTSARPYLFDLILHARMTQLFVFVSTFITTVVSMYLLLIKLLSLALSLVPLA